MTPLNTALCLDLGCWTDKLMESWATNFGESAWGLLSGAFTGEASFIAAEEFSVASMMTNSVAGVMAIVLIVFGAVQMVIDVRKGGVPAGLKTLFAILLAWPVTAVAVWVAMKLTRFFDQLSNAILSSSGGEDALAMLLKPSMTVPVVTSVASMHMIFMLVIWLVSLVLSLIMIIRNFVILALIAIAPMALMVLPAEFSRAWAKNWAGALLAALLIKPLSAVIIVLAANLMAHTEGYTSVLTGIVGLVLAAASPMFASQLFGFANLQAGEVGTQTASQTSSAAQNTASRVQQGVYSAGMARSQRMNSAMAAQGGSSPSTVQPSAAPKFGAAQSANPSPTSGGSTGSGTGAGTPSGTSGQTQTTPTPAAGAGTTGTASTDGASPTTQRGTSPTPSPATAQSATRGGQGMAPEQPATVHGQKQAQASPVISQPVVSTRGSSASGEGQTPGVLPANTGALGSQSRTSSTTTTQTQTTVGHRTVQDDIKGTRK